MVTHSNDPRDGMFLSLQEFLNAVIDSSTKGYATDERLGQLQKPAITTGDIVKVRKLLDDSP